ncbi:MAG: UvrD-helicase domain-containing protein, partial [Mogibacterium sp.]|nr:UvrD-helicase domain-containing protein [Mogibacterium sp.]
MSKDIDMISRERIRHDIGSNFFVEAGAGSGKTSVLVDRMVAMVEGGMDISRICAITFTKAAAGEFYARFQEALSKSDSENAKKALQDIDLCFMGTIDSFCNMVLSEHPAAAGIPSNAIVVDKEAMDSLLLREYSKIKQGAAGEELRAKAERFSGCFYNAEEIFLKGMTVLSESKNAHFNYVAPPAMDPDSFFGEKRIRLIHVLRFLHDHPEALATDKPKAAAESYAALIDSIDIIEDSWNDDLGNVERALNNLKGLRVIPEYDIDALGPGWENYFVPHFTRSKLSWYEIDPDSDPLMTEAIKNLRFSIAADFVNDCLDDISAALKEEGKLSFTDYLLYLRDLLKKDSCDGGKLIRHIYERHSYFLIDEFQDTNPLQAEVFFYLTAKEPKENWQECIPHPGSLFIVGDPKQSIYRFRNADVASFLRIRELFRNPDVGEVLMLYRNFRSTDKMCIWFNRAFSGLLPEDTDIQSRFSEIPTGEKGVYDSPVEGAYLYTVPYSRSVAGSDDPHKVAQIIQKMISRQDVPINNYSDFMIITPGKTHLSHYMNALSEAGIPFRIEGKVLFNECEPLRSLSYLMSAVSDPFDAKAVFAAMYLSGCKVTEDELHAYSMRAKSMSPAAVFTMLIEEERVFARAGTHNAEYVWFALELLRSAEVDGTVSSVEEGAAYIAGLVNDESSEERCIQLRRDANRVHIANLHKVKGLQAPAVILADPSSHPRGAESRVDYSTAPPESYLFAFDNSLKTTDYADEKEKEEEVLAAEKLRLLYVAATRAEKVLIVSAALKSSGDYSSSNPWLPL